MTKIPPEFADFLHTGKLGRLDPSVASHRAQVRQLLGKPRFMQEERRSNDRTMQWLVYGDVIVYFFNDVFYSIEISYRLEPSEALHIPASLEAPWLASLRGVYVMDIKQYLKAYRIHTLRVTFDHLDIDEDAGMSEVLETRPIRTHMLFDEAGLLEQMTYDPYNPGRFTYEELW